MSKRARSRKEQEQHDQKVLEISRKLENKGYKVKADIKGYSQPDTIGYKDPRRPDIYASGQGWERIVEVETPSSMHTKRFQKQDEKFKSWARRKDNRKYDLEVVPK